MDAREAARQWAHVWSQAWPAKDVEAIARLYADSAAYRSHPFREPKTGQKGALEYTRWAFADEDAIQCWFGEPIVQGARASVQWWATFTTDGKEWTLAGTSILRFDEDGQVLEHWDYWVQDEGRRTPPVGWGA